jgi:translation initiation factor 2 gamma subunit (eIF-2gamma)
MYYILPTYAIEQYPSILTIPQPHASEQTLIRELNLDYISENAWIIIPCSALKTINVDEVVQWLINKSNA